MQHQNEAELFLLEQFENILDVLHCSANEIFTSEPTIVENKDEYNKSQVSTKEKNIEEIVKRQEEREKPPKETAYINQNRVNSKTTIKGESLNLPKRQVLQNHRAWERAFRPLKLEENDKYKDIIDIKKTVDFIAQTEIEQIIFKPKRKEVYILNLLIDKDHTMEVFTELIDEFVSSVEHYGIFFSVHLFYLDGATIYRDKSLNKKVESLYYFSQKNSLTLIVSNCLSYSWKNNEMFKLISDISKYSFCTIVQMLPSHLWLLTALGKGTQLTFKYKKESKVSNSNLKSEDESYFFEENQKVFKVPVIAFDTSSFFVWSSFASGDRRFEISGMAFDNLELDDVQTYEFSEQERLDGFLENSTDMAIHLASYMANLPVSFDIARMIQEEKFSSSNITHLAEVFLGGIVKRVDDGNKVHYIFREKAQNYLKQFISAYDAYDLLEEFVSRKLNSSLNFSAFFANEKGLESMSIDDETLELMKLAIDIKKRMGGSDYDEAILKEKELDKYEDVVDVISITPPTKSFLMGSDDGDDDEKPVHKVTINYDFEISPYQVTVGEFRLFAEDGDGYKTEAEKGDGARVWNGKKWENKKDASWKNPYFEQTDDHPVVCVSWNDVQEYIKWLNKETGENYRLPTESEWEYSCRAGTTTKWSFGDDEKELEKYAWYNSNDGKRTKEVGTREPNPWGLHDMHGNVWEWCQDDWIDSYDKTPRDGKAYEDKSSGTKVLRGGSWFDDSSVARSSYRVRYDPTDGSDVVGFRLLGTLP